MSTKWVLHICGKLSVGGVQAVLMNFYRNIDRSKVQFAFAVQRNYPYSYDDEIKQMGGRVHYLPDMVQESQNFKNSLYDLLKSYPEYSIVECHFNFRNWKMLKIAKQAGVPIRISHAHAANKKERITTKVHLGVLARLIRYYATHLVSCSIISGEYLYETKNFTIIHNALDLEMFGYSESIRANKRNELNIGNKIALCEIGHLNDCKNQLFTLDVLSKLKQNYVLYLVGVGEEYKRLLDEKIKELDLENRVFFLGERHDVYGLLQAFDIMIFPSKHEGLSVVCMEAQASGLPIITSDQVPVEVAVTDLVSFKPINNPNEWAQLIKKTDVSHRCNAKQQLIDNGYDIKSEAEKLEKYYLKLYGELNV
jgi:glycosyltransferase involved in cell wall biosynthesis